MIWSPDWVFLFYLWFLFPLLQQVIWIKQTHHSVHNNKLFVLQHGPGQLYWSRGEGPDLSDKGCEQEISEIMWPPPLSLPDTDSFFGIGLDINSWNFTELWSLAFQLFSWRLRIKMFYADWSPPYVVHGTSSVRVTPTHLHCFACHWLAYTLPQAPW